MADWETRLREAAYNSPNGERYTFQYEDVSESFDRQTTAFEFPDADGTFIQDLGNSSRRFPFKVIFWGENYDLEAVAFMEAVSEQGVGILEHPTYGVKNVVPFGTIKRTDALTTGSNQTTIEVAFWETVEETFGIQADPQGDTLNALDAYGAATAEQFNGDMQLDTVASKAIAVGGYKSLLDKAKAGLQKVADAQADVSRQFDAIYNSIDSGLTTLISDPLTLAFQTVQLLQSPARALTSIQARLDAYGNLAAGIFGADSPTDSNAFHVNDLYASTYTSATVLSVVNNEFSTKSDAIGAADSITQLMDMLILWRDGNLDTLGIIDTGESYTTLQDAVSTAVAFLVEISFTLKQERTIILTRARTIIDLCAELNGSIDDITLNFFINSNNLTGSEILELPKGREIVYYI